jgi:predicted nuclease of predicted toxin-antitoxin system
MRLLADENFPAPAVAALRRLGHDVLAVAESMPGVSDAEVLATAGQQDRVLLTLDRDYGDLIFHHGQPAPAGVILFRLAGRSPQDDNQRMLQALQQAGDCAGRFTTVTDTLIRSRAFPRPAGS